MSWYPIALGSAYLCFLGSVVFIFKKVEKDRPGLVLVKLLNPPLMFWVIWRTADATRSGTALRPLAAWGLLVLSVCLYFYAARTIGSRCFSLAFSRDQPQALVRTGAFALVRHPFYTSYILGFASPAIYAPGMETALPLALIIVLYVTAARADERKILGYGGELAHQYATYRQQVGFMFPKKRTRDAA